MKKEIHGKSGTRLYNIWLNMKNRCYGKAKSKERDTYKDLDVCDDWRNSFISFEKWSLMNGYSADLSIDRINNDYGYYPENCRWANNSLQNCNNRTIRSNNTSGFRGVYYYEDRNKKWWAYINKDSKRKSLGYFYSPMQAAYAYNSYIEENNLPHPKNKLTKKSMLYLMKTVGNLADNINKGRTIEEDIKLYIAHLDGIAKLKGYSLSECLSVSYNDIKDRKGHMNENGVFIKEGDTK